MKKRSSVKKIIILVTVLALPGFLYYLLQEKGENRYKPLHIFGPKKVASTFHTKRGKQIPDTIYHTIRDFKLLSSRGDSIGIPTDSNHITVVNFFFTKCKSFCKEMNAQMARVASTYAGNRKVHFYSITVDPEHDTPEVLSEYAKSVHADPADWSFLTGNKDFIYELAQKDFLVDAYLDSNNPENIIHSPMLILVDPDKRIRGFYDSSSKDQVNKLIDEIKVQITEELRKVTSLKPKKQNER